MTSTQETPYLTPESNLEETQHSSKPELVFKSPRSPKLEFLLHFSTFGIYTCFWFVGRMREFKAINKSNVTPWLWFFVPNIFIAQLFALPKFIDQLRDAESKLNIEPWGAWKGGWIASVLVLTFAWNLSSSLVIPNWTILLLLAGWALVFSITQKRINNIKEDIKNVSFKGGYKKYNIIEWIVVIVLTPITTSLLLFLTFEPLLITKIQSLEANSVYVDKNGNYSFPVLGEGWDEVAIGTYSNGDADFEAKGPTDGMYLIVFNHGVDDTINSIANFRIFNNYESATGINCTENRRLTEDSESVISNIVCEGSYFGDPIMQTVSIIETDAGIYELYGEVNTIRTQYNMHISSLKKIAEGFKPL